MEDRFKNILGLLSGEGGQFQMGVVFSPYVIKSFQEVNGNEYASRFELKREISMMMRLADPDLKEREGPTFCNFHPPASGDSLFSLHPACFWSNEFSWAPFPETEFQCRGKSSARECIDFLHRFGDIGIFEQDELLNALEHPDSSLRVEEPLSNELIFEIDRTVG